jgi:arylsulfatase A-like enzyme
MCQRIVLALVLALFPTTVQAADLPSIVYLLADDLGIGDPGCFNPKSKIPTPNLDRLAREGVRCTDVHSSSAVCTPTRYGIMTGQYAWRTRLKQGVFQGYDTPLIEPGRMTVASLLKQHGYATACVGKWHLGLGMIKPTDYDKPLSPGPRAVGFDYFFGIPASLDMVPYVYVENEKVLAAPTEKIADSASQREGGMGFFRGGPIAPGFKHDEVLPRCTDKAIAWLEEQAKSRPGKPFFLYFALTGPHTPWLPTKEFAGKSQAGAYGDFVVETDASMGRILETLDRLKLTDTTLVIATSDNGAHWLPADIAKYDHRANLHYRGQKADIHEGGHRIPFLARWPGKIKPGTVSEATFGLQDLLASCADIVGVKLPDNAGEDSLSFLPALQGMPPATGREAIVVHSGQGMFAIRKGPWKLIDGLGSGGFTAPATVKPQPDGPTGQLFNLADDPEEKTNLFQKKPEVVKELAYLLAKYKSTGRSR